MKLINLTRGLAARVDDDDYALLSVRQWYATLAGDVWYARHYGSGYMHRVITGAADGQYVDHIDMDTLNNTRGNLRVVSNAQNQWNRGPYKSNASGLKGVCYCRSTGRWRSEIQADGKRLFLGRFDSKESAYAAYCQAAKKMHGAFARSK